MNETERMKELVKKLNEAAKAYYQEDREIMSNLEYDTLYDELQVLEEKTGVTLAGSPTTKVGYEAMDELPKEAHESPMLSLDKTKDVEVLRSSGCQALDKEAVRVIKRMPRWEAGRMWDAKVNVRCILPIAFRL